MATPPFDAPDEAPHYLRALSLAHGVLVGHKIPDLPRPPLSAAQLRWVDQNTRAVHVERSLAPGGIVCVTGQPDVVSSGCTEATEVGNYLPLPYLLPALVLKVSHSATTALWLSRIASALPCMALLVLALWLLWDGTVLSAVGFVAATTPMVLFVCAVLNPNGLEVAAAIAFAASIIRIWRDGVSAPAFAWVAFTISGTVTVLAWQLGPVYAAGELVVGAALIGSQSLAGLWRASRRVVLASGLLLAAAVAAFVVYGVSAGLLHSTVSLRGLSHGLKNGLHQLVGVLEDAVGTFGSLSVPLPSPVRWAWWGGSMLLIGVGLIVASRTQRRTLCVACVLALAFPVVLYACTYRFTGFGLQGRYMLPALCCVPLLAGELISRTVSSGRRGQVATASAIVLAVAVQLYAWLYNAHVQAGAPDLPSVFTHAGWHPPGGWTPWGACEACGAALICYEAIRHLVRPLRTRAIEPLTQKSAGESH